MQVTAGRAEELERTRPFGVIASAFGCVRSSPDPQRAAIARLPASGDPGEQGPSRCGYLITYAVPTLMWVWREERWR